MGRDPQHLAVGFHHGPGPHAADYRSPASPFVKVVSGVYWTASRTTADLEHLGLDPTKHAHLDLYPVLPFIHQQQLLAELRMMHVRFQLWLARGCSDLSFRCVFPQPQRVHRAPSVALSCLASEPNPTVAVMGWFQPTSRPLQPPCSSAAKRSAASPTQWDLASRSNGG